MPIKQGFFVLFCFVFLFLGANRELLLFDAKLGQQISVRQKEVGSTSNYCS